MSKSTSERHCSQFRKLIFLCLPGDILPHRGHDGVERPPHRGRVAAASGDPDAAAARGDGGAVPPRGRAAPGGPAGRALAHAAAARTQGITYISTKL